MKKSIIILTASLVVLLCYTLCFQDRVADLFAQLSFSKKTESSEILSGCVGYYSANKRWPRTEAEIRNGMKLAHLEPKYLNQVKNLSISDKAGVLDISFTTRSGVRMTLHSEIQK